MLCLGKGGKPRRNFREAKACRRHDVSLQQQSGHFGAGCSLKVTSGVGRGLQWAGRGEVAACVASVAVLVNP